MSNNKTTNVATPKPEKKDEKILVTEAYVISQGRSLKFDKKRYNEGDIVKGLSEKDIKIYLSDGTIEKKLVK